MTKLFEFYLALTTPTAKDERGATATEYGMLVAFIAITLVAALLLFGGSVSTFFEGIGAVIEGWVDGL